MENKVKPDDNVKESGCDSEEEYLTAQQRKIIKCSQSDLNAALEELLKPDSDAKVEQQKKKASIAMKTIGSLLKF